MLKINLVENAYITYLHTIRQYLICKDKNKKNKLRKKERKRKQFNSFGIAIATDTEPVAPARSQNVPYVPLSQSYSSTYHNSSYAHKYKFTNESTRDSNKIHIYQHAEHTRHHMKIGD